MVSSISDFYEKNKNNNTLISFLGKITPMSISEIMQKTEEDLEKINENTKVIRKIYNVLIECLQNLYHHADDVEFVGNNSELSALCIINNNPDCYIIVSGNYIRNDKIENFRASLDKINQLSREELKEYYKAVLNNGQKSLKDGAGLGMIEISKRTSEKLDFEFIPIDDNYSLFILNIKIQK